LTLSVVIPCFNEEKGIEAVLRSLPKCVDEVIVVDNGSTDSTAAVAERLGAKVVFEKRRGYGRAYRTGLPLAKGDVIATLDGDGQYPSSAIPPIIDHMVAHQIDFVSAARFPLVNGRAMSLRSIVGNKIQTYTVRVLFFVWIMDSQSGMWVFKRRVLDRLTLVSDGMSFSEEIKIEAMRHRDVRFGEFPIDYHERIGETKLYPWRDGIQNMWFLVKRRLRR
jgi:hypothetical protein